MIFPLNNSYSTLDIKVLRDLAHKVLKEDISSFIKDERSGLVALSKFRHNQVDNFAIENVPMITKHITFGFIIPCNKDAATELITECEHINFTLVEVDQLNCFLIASGPLNEWVFYITSRSNADVYPETLKVMNELYRYFDKAGLTFLFRGYSKEKHKDGFVLEFKGE